MFCVVHKDDKHASYAKQKINLLAYPDISFFSENTTLLLFLIGVHHY